MVSKQQLERAKKVIVKATRETDKRYYLDMVYIDKKGRHEHTVSWDKSFNTLESLRYGLWCDCTACSSYEIFTKKLCIYKIRAILWFVEHGIWKPLILEYLYGDE